jgi:hypothetical protein
MSVWRPSARVESPDGHAWEIYAYRIQLRDRDDWDTGIDDLEVGSLRARSAFALLDAIVWLVLLVPRAIVRFGEFALAGARALRSDEWTIEAIAFTPRRESYAWTTTTEYKGQVLAQVEGHLARGDIPQRLTNATYLGLRR